MKEEHFSIVTEACGGSTMTYSLVLTANAVVDECKRIIDSIGAKAGIIVDVKAIDSEDSTVIHWKYAEGLVFPPPDEGHAPYGKWG